MGYVVAERGPVTAVVAGLRLRTGQARMEAGRTGRSVW